MTATQKARLIGFNASLKKRGVFVKLQPTGLPRLWVLVQPIPPKTEQYPLSNELRNYSIVSALRTDVESVEIIDGSYFLSDDGETRFRVALVEANPQDIKVSYHCEVSPAE